MSYEEETTDLRAQVREFALEAAKERSLAEQATRARNTAQASVRELEAEAKVHILDGMTQRARAEKAEARVAELETELKRSLIKQHLFVKAPTVSFPTAEMLMRIALGAPCACVPNGEACLGHQFIRIWYEEKGALRDADPECVKEAEAGMPFRRHEAREREEC